MYSDHNDSAKMDWAALHDAARHSNWERRLLAVLKASGRIETQLREIGVEAWMQADPSVAASTKRGKTKSRFQCGEMVWYIVNDRKLLQISGKDRRRLDQAIKSRNGAAHHPEDEQSVVTCSDAVATFEWFGTKLALLGSGRPAPAKAVAPVPAVVAPRPVRADRSAPVVPSGAALPMLAVVTASRRLPTTRPNEERTVTTAPVAASGPSLRRQEPSYWRIAVVAGLVAAGGAVIALGSGSGRPPRDPPSPLDPPTSYAPIGASVSALLPDAAASHGREIGAVTLLHSARQDRFSVVFTTIGAGREAADVRVLTYSDTEWSPRVSYDGFAFVGDGAAIAPDGSISLVMGGDDVLVYADDRGGRWTRRPRPVPGMPPGNGTISIDPNGTVHVTSNIALNARYYTSLRGSRWDTPTVVSPSSTGPAAVLADDTLTLTHADWARRSLMRSDGLGSPSVMVLNYAIDQGPPQSLASGTCGRVLAFSATRDHYVNYSLFEAHQMPGTSTWSAVVELRSALPAISDVAVACGPGTSAFVFACDGRGATHIVELRSGRAVLSTVLAVPACGGALDAVVVDTRAYLAYADASRTELLVRSVDLTALR